MGRWFPFLYDKLMGPLEERKLKAIRSHWLEGVHGEILEVGAGTGVNFPLYSPPGAVTAIEPNPLMSERAHVNIEQAKVPVEVVQAGAEQLPFEDGRFDAVVCTLVFCTIPDPAAALKEIQRVLKPGGKLIFIEHVRLNKPFLGALQDWLTPAWKHICDGCHLNRDTVKLIRDAGLDILRTEEYAGGLFVAVEAFNK